jgi:predicted Zn-dependent protease
VKPHNMLVLAVALAMAAAVPCSAEKDKEQTKADREQKRRDREVKKAEKEATRYEKLKEFSLNLYENDFEFRDAVDAHYEDVLRAHSEQAFSTNVNRDSRTIAIQEDRFREHYSLYDNLVIQDYVNRLGQRLVPSDSEKLFAFRLVPHPIPYATTLATGTIYISTGLVAMLDSEAQLAYVLAHEMAHVYKDHWKLKSIVALGETEYNKKQETKRAWWGLIGAAAGAGLGGAIGGSGSAAGWGALAGGIGGMVASSLMNPRINLDWDKVQEDEADKIAFKAALDLNYDVREVPRLYLALQGAAGRDTRVGLGFIGSRKRVRERTENAKDLIENAYKAEIDMKQNEGKLIGDNPEFRHLMAELKRDNGIFAFYYDMFDMARNNLSEAVSIRSNDSAAQYYYGKVLKLVGRTPEEKKLADECFIKAAKLDVRGRNFGAHLHRALAMMDDKSEANKKLILEELQAYVNTYLKFAVNNARGARLLPPNLDTVYEYMSVLGDNEWAPTLPDNTPLFLEANEVKIKPNANPLQTPSLPVQPAASQQPQPQSQKVRRLPNLIPGRTK